MFASQGLSILDVDEGEIWVGVDRYDNYIDRSALCSFSLTYYKNLFLSFSAALHLRHLLVRFYVSFGPREDGHGSYRLGGVSSHSLLALCNVKIS